MQGAWNYRTCGESVFQWRDPIPLLLFLLMETSAVRKQTTGGRFRLSGLEVSYFHLSGKASWGLWNSRKAVTLPHTRKMKLPVPHSLDKTEGAPGSFFDKSAHYITCDNYHILFQKSNNTVKSRTLDYTHYWFHAI